MPGQPGQSPVPPGAWAGAGAGGTGRPYPPVGASSGMHSPWPLAPGPTGYDKQLHSNHGSPRPASTYAAQMMSPGAGGARHHAPAPLPMSMGGPSSAWGGVPRGSPQGNPAFGGKQS